MEQPATVELFRECDQSGTLAQQHVGLQGRRVRPAKRQLEAAITKLGKRYNIGTYGTAEEAHAAYVAKARELHGEFARAQ